MTNGEKYKTAEERYNKFIEFCDSHEKCDDCPFDEVSDKLANRVLGCACEWCDSECKEQPITK